MRTKQEIASEVSALRALKPAGRWSQRTQQTIDTAVEFLSGEIDTTADEFFEMPEHLQMAVTDAETWRNGDSDDRPSAGWGPLVESIP